jgi:heme-degrading monooxygenase HmoA
MHAVVVRVSISDVEKAQTQLRQQVVPQVSSAPGFVAGYWTRSDGGQDGLSMIVFESEDAARAAADGIPGHVPEGVTLENVEVREVVENA